MFNQNSSQWNLGRFFQTLTYFEVIPFLNWVQQLGTDYKDNKDTDGAKQVGVILVAGATGGLGKRVVRRLIEQGYKVRCLVRDIDKARSLFDAEVDIVVADITSRETLTPVIDDKPLSERYWN